MNFNEQEVEPHLIGEKYEYLPWDCPQPHTEGSKIVFEGFHFVDKKATSLTAYGRCPYCGTIGEIPQLKKSVVGPNSFDLYDPRLRSTVLGNDIVERRAAEDLRDM